MKTVDYFYVQPQCEIIELQQADVLCASASNPFKDNTEWDYDD